MDMREKRWRLADVEFKDTVYNGTNGEKALFLYLEGRKLKRAGPVTRTKLEEDLGFSPATAKRAFYALVRQGVVVEERAL